MKFYQIEIRNEQQQTACFVIPANNPLDAETSAFIAFENIYLESNSLFVVSHEAISKFYAAMLGCPEAKTRPNYSISL